MLGPWLSKPTSNLELVHVAVNCVAAPAFVGKLMHELLKSGNSPPASIPQVTLAAVLLRVAVMVAEEGDVRVKMFPAALYVPVKGPGAKVIKIDALATVSPPFGNVGKAGSLQLASRVTLTVPPLGTPFPTPHRGQPNCTCGLIEIVSY
jgi:hypothetical protein